MLTDPGSERDALLRTLVMSAIADDYEDFATVVHEVTGWAAEQNVHFDGDEIWLTLRRLIELDFAKAYRLFASSDPPEVVGDITPAAMEDCHFLLTPRGHEAVDQGQGNAVSP